jgi:hypothetical protein
MLEYHWGSEYSRAKLQHRPMTGMFIEPRHDLTPQQVKEFVGQFSDDTAAYPGNCDGCGAPV